MLYNKYYEIEMLKYEDSGIVREFENVRKGINVRKVKYLYNYGVS